MSIHFNPYSASVAIWQQGIEKKIFFEHVFGISITVCIISSFVSGTKTSLKKFSKYGLIIQIKFFISSSFSKIILCCLFHCKSMNGPKHKL